MQAISPKQWCGVTYRLGGKLPAGLHHRARRGPQVGLKRPFFLYLDTLAQHSVLGRRKRVRGGVPEHNTWLRS